MTSKIDCAELLGRLPGELAANLSRGVPDINPETREGLLTAGLRETFIDTAVVDQLTMWMSVASQRLSQSRATAIARRSAT